MRHLAIALGLLAAAAAPIRAHGSDHPIEGDRLRLKDPTNPKYRAASFHAVRESTLAPSVSDDPRVLGATLEISGSLPGDGTSGTIILAPELWTGYGNPPGSTGFRYYDQLATTGVKKVMFKSGRRGVKLTVRARGTAWPYDVTQAQGPIRVRFQVGDELYCTEFTTFTVNQAGAVRASDAPKPAGCTPPVCGNGSTEVPEECDDGGTDPGDGCSDTCELEDASALCAGIPTVSGTTLRAERIASGLSSPVGLTAAPLDPNRLFVLEQVGRIRIIKYGNVLPTPFLDITDQVACCGERGLLGLAFHPDFESNGRFFVNYTNTSGNTVIARYQVGADPDQADETTAQTLLTITQPFANHNGGNLAFGPDGYLYTGMGDGGSGGDPLEAAQDMSTLLGKMLRLDVDVETPPYYTAPATNPFFTAPADELDLIWALGLRNPWRFSFDRATGDLYIGDVGQGSREEVSVPLTNTGGENYGWDIFEGNMCYEPAPDPQCPDPPTGFTMPVHEYTHGEGCSVTGGHVYRGCRLPDLHGTYFYADFCSAFVRSFQYIGGIAQNHDDWTTELAVGGGPTIDLVSSFGLDARGELYVVDLGGEVFRLEPAP